MTIDSAYFPEIRKNHGGTAYQFGFEIIDPAYIEVYAIDASDVYTLIDPSEYTVTIATYIAPISKGGIVTFLAPLASTVAAISIQRKTDITDEQEFPTGQAFNAESFEFQADKLTMILQELNAHKCDCSSIGGGGGTVPPPPGYSCSAYEEALLASTATDVWLMTDKVGNWAAGATISAERSTMTLKTPNGGVVTTPGVLADPCSTETSINGRQCLATNGPTGWTFAMAIALDNNGANDVDDTVLWKRRSSANYIGIGFPYVNGNHLRIQFEPFGAPLEDVQVDDYRVANERFVLGFEYNGSNGAWKLYKNWDVVASGTGPIMPNTGSSPQIAYFLTDNAKGKGSHLAYWNNLISDAERLVLKDGWDRNFSSYVPPP